MSSEGKVNRPSSGRPARPSSSSGFRSQQIQGSERLRDVFRTAAEIGANGEVETTQRLLQNLITKPILTDKLLSKPPFRFLHDILTSLLSTSGFPKGLFTEDELNAELMKDKEAKMSFLQRLIDFLGLYLNTHCSARPRKIVAGSEPEKTNEMLQLLAIAAKIGNSYEEAIARVLAGQSQPNEDGTPSETPAGFDPSVALAAREKVERDVNEGKKSRPSSARPFDQGSHVDVHSRSGTLGVDDQPPDEDEILITATPWGITVSDNTTSAGKITREFMSDGKRDEQLPLPPVPPPSNKPSSGISAQALSQHVSSHSERVRRIQNNVLEISNSAFPIGQVVSFLGSSTSDMTDELMMWQNESRRTRDQLSREVSESASVLTPLQRQLTDIEERIQAQRRINGNMLANIKINEAKVIEILDKLEY